MFDAIIKQASDASTLSFEYLDNVSRNLANMNTWGYKGKRFYTFLSPEGTTQSAQLQDMSEGPSLITQRDLDVAVHGQGFIQITRPDGQTAYTRFGSFTVNNEGFITTPYGDLVGAGIQLPANYQKVRIDRDGKVKIIEKIGDDYEVIGTIPTANFPNPAGLKKIGFNAFCQTEESGQPVATTEATEIYQGYLERANVDVNQAVTEVLRLNAGSLANLRIVKLIDQLYQEASNLRQ